MQTYWLIENSCEDKQEDDIKEIYGGNGDVEGVGLFVHPWSKNANSNEESCFDYYQGDSLGCTAVLGEGYEYGFNEYIS